MAEITLKYAKGYEICCPLCGTPEDQSPVRYPDAQNPGENWIKCSRCGTSYQPPVYHAAGGGNNLRRGSTGNGGDETRQMGIHQKAPVVQG